MAPIDRHERRQQRVRGAGPSAVLANFGFDIANLAPKSAKQASLPPISLRRTPTPSLKTPRGSAKSAKRHRSASVRRSSSAKQHITPQEQIVTPHLGKRKRGSQHARLSEDDGEPDELSPDRDNEVRSIEKSRKVAGTVSPIREEVDEAPDELSFLQEDLSSVQKPAAAAPAVARQTPSQKRASSGAAPEKTPIADRIGSMSINSQTAIVRTPRSTEAPPTTPGMLPNRRSRASSASHFRSEFNTPVAAQDEEDSEDELTPPQFNGTTPRIVGQQQHTQTPIEIHGEEMDELSTPAQASSTMQLEKALSLKQTKQQSLSLAQPSAQIVKKTASAKRHRRQRVVMDEEEDEEEEDEVQSTPAVSKARRTEASVEARNDANEDEAPDEISPDAQRSKRRHPKVITQEREVVDVSSVNESDDYEPGIEDVSTIRAPPAASKQKPHKSSSNQPPRKRPNHSGSKQAISVMRIKGSTVRGITAADTTRTILEQNISHQINRMVDKMQKVQDASRRKQMRGEINLALAFKESLDEKLLDLQDANDTLSTVFKKRRILKNSNIEKRKEILALQNNRYEIALEMDDEQTVFDTKKEKVEARDLLSSNMFEIEAAIQSGRQRARKQGREYEGPDVPLSMLLQSVARDVGSAGGGLLTGISDFNGGLEKAAAWLEGRA